MSSPDWIDVRNAGATEGGMVQTITKSGTRSLLQASPNRKVSTMAQDAEFVTTLTAVLNASLEIAEEFPQTRAQLATAIVKKGVAMSAVAAKAADSKNLELANFAASQTLKTIGLTKIAGMTPARASMFITLTMAEKVVAVAGLGQLDKCHMAIATFAVSTGVGGFACVGTVGIGCVAGAIAVAADAFNMYAQCSAPNAPKPIAQ